MKRKKHGQIFITLGMVFLLCAAVLSGCFFDFYDDYYDARSDYPQNSAPPENRQNSLPVMPGSSDSGVSFALDKSSADVFIEDIDAIYSISLIDSDGLLSSSQGSRLMDEIERGLSLFSPGFIRKMVAFYAEYGSVFFMVLENAAEDGDYGVADWDGDITIYLYYNLFDELNGITAAVLAHEFTHAAHYIIEEYIGEEQSERDMMSFNGDFFYSEDDYDYLWNERLHSATFAYDYGMANYYDDMAAIVELLVERPEEMAARHSDHQNEPLYLKTRYIRDAMYMYISDECRAVFAPLYYADEVLEQAA